MHCNRLNSIRVIDWFVADLSRTLSQTSRHVKMVCVRDFPRGEILAKVGIMEFGLCGKSKTSWCLVCVFGAAERLVSEGSVDASELSRVVTALSADADRDVRYFIERVTLSTTSASDC